MIKKILFTLIAIVVILMLIGMSLSTHYESSRSVVIQAPTEKIYPFFADLKNWPQWDPFVAADPTAKLTLSEQTTGVGATRSWTGEQSMGKLTFTACDPKTGVDYDLVFTNGKHDSPAKSWMHMSPRPDGTTELVWGMNGEMNMPVIGGYFAMCADRFIGPEFERGLAGLKAKAEATASAGN